MTVMKLVRVWLPVIVIVGGIVAIALKPDENGLLGGAMIVGAGLAIWLLNVLYRIGVTGDAEREEEDRARAFFDAHGHWPDEPPPPSRRR
jgi:hypothetical protein